MLQRRPENITLADWDAQLAFWNDPRNQARTTQNCQNRAKSTVVCRQGSRSLARLRDQMMESSSTREYPSLIHTFFVTHTVGEVFVWDEDRALYRLGFNTETGVPYTKEEIMAIVRKGKKRGHLLGVGRVLSGRATGGCPPPPQSIVDPADVEKLKKRVPAGAGMMSQALMRMTRRMAIVRDVIYMATSLPGNPENVAGDSGKCRSGIVRNGLDPMGRTRHIFLFGIRSHRLRPSVTLCTSDLGWHFKSGTKSNAIFALPYHGSTSSVSRKSNAIFALPDHGSTSFVGRKSNAIFALPDHESTSSISRKSNAIFALPGHGSTSSVGSKSNAIFSLPGHESTSSVGRKSNSIFALPRHESTSSPSAVSRMPYSHYPDYESTSSAGLCYTGSAFIIINPSHYPLVRNKQEWYLANASVTPTIENVFFLRGLYRLATGNQASEHNHPTHVRGCRLR
nr:hypothetical protein [Tanacetum cinerariifolium]